MHHCGMLQSPSLLFAHGPIRSVEFVRDAIVSIYCSGGSPGPRCHALSPLAVDSSAVTRMAGGTESSSYLPLPFPVGESQSAAHSHGSKQHPARETNSFLYYLDVHPPHEPTNLRILKMHDLQTLSHRNSVANPAPTPSSSKPQCFQRFHLTLGLLSVFTHTFP